MSKFNKGDKFLGKNCEGLEYIDHTNVTHWMYMPKPPKDD